MRWREQLRPAGFRGAAFEVAAHSADAAGRRVQVHEYPGRDRPYPEDLGRKTAEFTVEAYVVGPDYMAARDRLIAACTAAGPGLLEHPYLGRLNVVCTGCRLIERADEGGIARLTLSFVEAGENRFPSATNDAAAAVDRHADAALRATEARLAETFDATRLPGFVASTATEIPALIHAPARPS